MTTLTILGIRGIFGCAVWWKRRAAAKPSAASRTTAASKAPIRAPPPRILLLGVAARGSGGGACGTGSSACDCSGWAYACSATSVSWMRELGAAIGFSGKAVRLDAGSVSGGGSGGEDGLAASRSTRRRSRSSRARSRSASVRSEDMFDPRSLAKRVTLLGSSKPILQQHCRGARVLAGGGTLDVSSDARGEALVVELDRN